jgi:hypothetical protein
MFTLRFLIELPVLHVTVCEVLVNPAVDELQEIVSAARHPAIQICFESIQSTLDLSVFSAMIFKACNFNKCAGAPVLGSFF